MFGVDRIWRKLFEKRSRSNDLALMRSRIETFRDLLSANSKAMELIADAGEKLGGEYLFDIQYIRTLVDELETTVRRIVHNLNTMTGGRYPDLEEVFERLSLQIRACLEGRVVISEGKTVFHFSEIGQELSDVVGEKVARLGDLYKHFPSTVPNGFAVSAHACRRFLEANGVFDLLDTLRRESRAQHESLDKTAAQIQKVIRDARIPRDIARSITKAVDSLERKGIWRRKREFFAVRSSALGEDGDLTFAGLHETVLNVPANGILDAYKLVVASLFSLPALTYRRDHNISLDKAYMGVGCQVMAHAVASGVIYTVDPMNPMSDHVIITAAPGYGKAVVQGEQQVDRFVLRRSAPNTIISRKIATKEQMYVPEMGGGTKRVSVPVDERDKPSVSDDTLSSLATLALRVERFMKCAQDIEWAQGPEGRVFLLQSRPLRLFTAREQAVKRVVDIPAKWPVLFKSRGEVACRGIGAGEVCIVQPGEDITHFPDGAVLVAKYASPQLSAIVSRASAVITDVGAAAGHLATITREYRVPALVDTSIATTTLEEGMEITVDAEENVVYEGIVSELLHYQLLQSSSYDEAPEFRILRSLLRNIAPLHLHDPRSKEFSPAFCTTYHDIIRFAHEKAVTELGADQGVRVSRRAPHCRQVDLNIPIDLLVIDIDADHELPRRKGTLEPDEITCAPLRAILDGLTSPGAWLTEPADMDFGAFMSSATGPISGDVPTSNSVEYNLAIVSQEYLNLSLRLGYHFNAIDCVMSANVNDNYIYFRFAGGVTEITRRSRRARLIAMILDKCDFVTECTGDLIVARIKDLPWEVIRSRLSMLGRLIGFTRQLDTFLKSDDLVEYYAALFLRGEDDPPDRRSPTARVHSETLHEEASV